MEAHETIGLRGFFNVEITENIDGKEVVVGRAERIPNTIPAPGKLDYLVRLLAGSANSKQISHAALGTGGAPATNATVLAGENTQAAGGRDAVTASSNTSTAVRFYGTFASANSHNTTTINISNIGLFHTSTTNAATIFAGAAYASSSWATNQSVNYTYEITFT